MSLNLRELLNGNSKQDRIAEGGAILASIFSAEAIAA
jgi:hypothetical protein